MALVFSITISAAGQSTSQADIDQLQRNISTCRAGLDALVANLYHYPDKPDTGSAGKRAWKDVYGDFRASHRPACDEVGKFIKERSGQPIVKAVERAIEADGVANYEEYFTGRLGVAFHGDRILSYCPNLHRRRYDCVSASKRIGEISTPHILDKLDRLSALECVPESGWGGCRKIDGLAGVDLKIYSTPQVSVSAQKLVETVYKDMLSRLQPAYPASRLSGVKAYITNGEDWSELSKLFPVGSFANGDELRGSANGDYTWISEQMICKTGVKTRNAAFANDLRTKEDQEARTLDQVVHEFAHTIDLRYGLKAAYETDIFPGTADSPTEEVWAGGVQWYFRVPDRVLSDRQLTFLNQVFKGRTTYDCTDYKAE
jgi:hypothetical protein